MEVPCISVSPMQANKYNLSQKWDPYLKYEPLTLDCTDEELKEFLSRRTSRSALCVQRIRRNLTSNKIQHYLSVIGRSNMITWGYHRIVTMLL